ncbi:MAG: FadR/GntR family transcriptional regulator [Rhizobiaceae bacterium]
MTVFQPVYHARTADEVAHQIESLILQGVLRSGDQLPGERELAQETGVSRPTVRDAIKKLEGMGILEIRHGGGTFVANVIGTVFSPQISALLGTHLNATHDYLEYRREIETIAAQFAALRATESDLELFDALMKRMEAAFHADDFELEARVDIEFHSMIGEMAHNLVLLHTLRSCYQLLSEGVFQNRNRLYQTAGGRMELYGQHRAIHDAISRRDPESAARAARDHLDYVIAATREMELRQDREKVSELRLAKHMTNANRHT